MLRPSLHRVDIVTGSTGNYTENVSVPAGRLLQFRYLPSPSTAVIINTGADVTITGAQTGTSYLDLADFGTTAGFSLRPRQTIHTTTGTTGQFVTTGTIAVGELQRDFIYIAGEQLTVTITSTGIAKTGSMYLWIG